MKDTGSANDRQGSKEVDLLIKESVLAISLLISLHITEVTYMSSQILRTSMCVPLRVVVRPSCGASLEKVAILVDVETVLLAWVQTGEVALNLAQR